MYNPEMWAYMTFYIYKGKDNYYEFGRLVYVGWDCSFTFFGK